MTNTLLNVEKRSSRGCWTCRLRKVKCDEARGACQRCRRHGIPCAGYSNERPDWKDGGVKEADRLRVVKALVSERKKRNIALRQPIANPQAPLQKLASAEIEGRANSRTPKSSSLEAIANGEISSGNPPTMLKHGPHPLGPFSLSEERTSDRGTGNRSFSVEREAELVGHYFDHIFNLQFQHYAAGFSPQHWLLPLIHTISPLRSAILSISALHQYQLKRVATSKQLGDDGFHELQEHYGTALEKLRHFIAESSVRPSEASYVPIICCCVQLISFDLFQGGNRDWQTHLQAANGLVKSHTSTCMPGSHDQRQFFEDIASNFCTGALLWFDIISSATFGRRPMLYDSHQRLLRLGSPLINLRDIMGCENSIMVLMGEIAALYEWKMSQQNRGSLSTWRLVDRATWILEALENEVDRLEQILDLHDHDLLNSATESSITTTVFACAATVYLQTVVCGCHRFVSELRHAVQRTIKAMEWIQATDVGRRSRALVWPAVVTGCFADTSEVSFFRSFLSAGGDDALGFGNCRTAIDVLEACWEHNHDPTTADTDMWDWSRAMKELGYCTLLV